MKRFVLLLLLMASTVLMFAQTFERSETLYISGAAWGPPNDWNPFITWSKANTSGTVGLIYETLFMYDPLTDKYIPWLASEGKWTNKNTYELKLRDGITWTDGKPLTIDDVKFTFELGKKFTGVYYSNMWKYLKSIDKVGANGLKFNFTNKPLVQEFMNNLYNIAIVPKHLWENRRESDVTSGANEKPIGSGPYMYESHTTDRNVYVRNDNWWGTKILKYKPAPKRIVDIRFSSNSVALGSVLKGELDLSNNFLPGIAALVDQGYVSTYYPTAPYMISANTAVLFLNTTKSPMDDAAFRKALAHAINVDEIIKVAFAGLVKAANPTGLLPTLDKYVDKDTVAKLGFSYNVEKAKKLLADAGYKDINGDGFVETPKGAKIELNVTCPFGWTDWMEAIKVISKSCKAAGIKVEAKFPDYGAWNEALVSGTFDMTLNNWAGMSNTPWTLYNLLFRHPIEKTMGSGNFGRYNNPTLFALVDDLAAASDEASAKAICKKIQEIMLTDLPMIPLWYNGLWAQYSNDVWTGWPSDAKDAPKLLPCSWAGYWQMGGLLTLCNIKPAKK